MNIHLITNIICEMILSCRIVLSYKSLVDADVSIHLYQEKYDTVVDSFRQ